MSGMPRTPGDLAPADSHSLRDSHPRRPQDLITPAVAALHLIHDDARFVLIALYRANGFVQFRTKRLAHTLERRYALCLEQAQQLPVKDLYSHRQRGRRLACLLNGTVK